MAFDLSPIIKDLVTQDDVLSVKASTYTAGTYTGVSIHVSYLPSGNKPSEPEGFLEIGNGGDIGVSGASKTVSFVDSVHKNMATLCAFKPSHDFIKSTLIFENVTLIDDTLVDALDGKLGKPEELFKLFNNEIHVVVDDSAAEILSTLQDKNITNHAQSLIGSKLGEVGKLVSLLEIMGSIYSAAGLWFMYEKQDTIRCYSGGGLADSPIELSKIISVGSGISTSNIPTSITPGLSDMGVSLSSRTDLGLLQRSDALTFSTKHGQKFGLGTEVVSMKPTEIFTVNAKDLFLNRDGTEKVEFKAAIGATFSRSTSNGNTEESVSNKIVSNPLKGVSLIAANYFRSEHVSKFINGSNFDISSIIYEKKEGEDGELSEIKLPTIGIQHEITGIGRESNYIIVKDNKAEFVNFDLDVKGKFVPSGWSVSISGVIGTMSISGFVVDPDFGKDFVVSDEEDNPDSGTSPKHLEEYTKDALKVISAMANKTVQKD